jgi:hypothetical protein
MISKKANHYLTDNHLLYDDIIDYKEKQCYNLESFLPNNNFSFSDIIEQLNKLDGVSEKALINKPQFVMSLSQAKDEIDFLSELNKIIKTFEKSNLEVGLDYMETDKMKQQREETEKLLEQAKKELDEREKYLTLIVRANERKHKIHLKLMNVVKELEGKENTNNIDISNIFNKSIEFYQEKQRKDKIHLKLLKVQRLPMGTKRK